MLHSLERFGQMLMMSALPKCRPCGENDTRLNTHSCADLVQSGSLRPPLRGTTLNQLDFGTHLSITQEDTHLEQKIL